MTWDEAAALDEGDRETLPYASGWLLDHGYPVVRKGSGIVTVRGWSNIAGVIGCSARPAQRLAAAGRLQVSCSELFDHGKAWCDFGELLRLRHERMGLDKPTGTEPAATKDDGA